MVASRWQDYVIALGGDDDPPEALWAAAAAVGGNESRSMYLLGVGFDPRSLVGIQQFLAIDHNTPPVIGLIELPPPSHASGLVTRALAADNQAAFAELTSNLEVRIVPHEAVHTRSNAGPRIARAATESAFIAGVDHLLIDVSSLPSSIYFPVIAATLASVDRSIAGFPTQIQVVACENPQVDAAILELGINEAALVGGFRGDLEHESEPTETIIWAPVIGEHCAPALTAIHDMLAPSEVFPVLPFPSRNPRRADDLVLEHQVELLDQFRIDPSNFIYADERNPFDLYRTLCRLQHDYSLALDGFTTTTLALSTHSSKQLSLGVLLAAYEHELPIVAASALDYDIDAHIDLQALSTDHVITTVWLSGLPDPPTGEVPEPNHIEAAAAEPVEPEPTDEQANQTT